MTATPTRVRATTGDALLLTRRRSRQDAGLLVGTAVLLAAALLAVLAGPRLLESTAQEALRTAVTNAGAQATVVVTTGSSTWSLPGTPPLSEATGTASVLDARLDGMHPATAVAVSPSYRATAPELAFTARLVTLEVPADRVEPVRWTSGRAPVAVAPPAPPDQSLPPAPPGPVVVEVGLSATAARALGIDLADGPVPLRLAPPRQGTAHEARVTGLYEPLDPSDVRWETVPDLLGGTDGASSDAPVGLYVTAAARTDMALVMGTPLLGGTAVAVVDTDHLTVASARDVRRGVLTFMATASSVSTGLPHVIESFDAHLRATLAQASLVVVGVGATAACCLVLAAALLVERRRTHLSGERARGASLASVALRSAVESVPTAAVAALVAGGAVTLWLPHGSGVAGLVPAVVTVAVVAPVILAVRAAATAWTGRRVPADRRERARLAGLRSARRLVAELTAVTVAVAALVALRGRGLVPPGSLHADLLLASAPFLLAVAASLVVVRLAPAAVRVAARWAARSRGLAATLAATRAQRGATALLPLVTVTVAVALVVLSGVLVQTVRDGQRSAVDHLVAADVRLDGKLDTDAARDALARLSSADGVDAVATGSQLVARAFGRGTEPTATVLVVDSAALARVREVRGLTVDEGLAGLGDVSGDRLPVLATAGLADRVDLSAGTQLHLLSGRVDVDVHGPTTLTGDNGAPPVDARAAYATQTGDDGVVVVDTAALAARTDRLPATTRAWVAGPGAARAVADLRLADLPGVTVTTAEGWSRDWSRAPLPAALTTLLLAAVAALTVLAVVALTLVVVATSGERGRTLSTLRTLGLDARTGRWATVGELAPLVVGGFVGGTAIGLALPLLVGDALGLAWVTAAPTDVRVSLAWWPVLLAAGGLAVALLVAVVLEQAVRRRERLGDVLRVGAR